jgi:hypothetical protein
MADALEAAAAVLRRRAAAGNPGASEARHAGTLAERARQIHRMLGERQEQMLPLLAAAGEDGATSGDIARELEYDHANAMITLNAMVKGGLLFKDESAVPYRFRLVPELLDGTDIVSPGWRRGTYRAPRPRGTPVIPLRTRLSQVGRVSPGCLRTSRAMREPEQAHHQ